MSKRKKVALRARPTPRAVSPSYRADTQHGPPPSIRLAGIGRRSVPRLARDAGLERRQTPRRSALHLAELVLDARPWAIGRRRGDRRRRMADGAGRYRAVWWQPLVAGHAEH